MGNLVLFLPGHLGKGHFIFRQVKHRVIAEAPFALGLFQHQAGTLAPPHPFGAVGKDAGHRRNKSGAPLLPGNVLHIVEQKPEPVPVAARTIAGRVDSWCTSQSVHRQAGVVGQGRKAGGLAGRPGFDQGVFLKSIPIFFRLGVHTRFLHGQNLNAQSLEDGAHLPFFLLVVGCQYKSHSRSPMVSFWAAISSPMPFSARAYMASISFLEKGRSSPVPWSSMILPLSSMMKLKSTWAPLSST